MISNEELEHRAEITLDTCGGIQPMHMAFYGISIRYSAERALAAFELYDYLAQENADPASQISAVQEAVGHVGALSRYFWPSTAGKKKTELKQYELKLARGEKLRKQFKITEESPLSDRDLRNAWEHFDEKLDTYVLSNDAGYFFPTPMIESHELADHPVGKIFKLLDPEAECLVLLGKKFFFGPLRTEVERIFAANEQENS
ncbi:hypothetical protein E4634_09545 [Mangrovimicrobium sediminis]|uniref:Uncharacterized protein n=1 Tax=Mangrovimicrobium sediminis TaxID=2562682 RepID=A0A4Z0M4G2_9GAMM|nr:hypothetical protein [Haliea sp. SAOS-164]TGD74346.1 hypothetical protein E4634_09545 [Haliea sp. SAOS-164]